MFAAARDSFLSLVFPQQCKVCKLRDCGADDGAACSHCWAETRVFTGDELLCGKCGAFFDLTGAGVDIRCHKCDDHLYDHAFAAGVYESALSANILELKAQPRLAGRVRDAISSAWSREAADLDVILPVPLSRQRMLERGYNQAEIIADAVSSAIAIPVDNYSLTRAVHTPIHRVGMDDKARALTVVKAFRIARPKMIEGKRVLLVDDVFTSGATVSACAGVLKKSGASEVKVFTVARAVLR